MKNISKERWEQMMACHDNDAEWVEAIIEECGVEACERGWDVFDFDGTGMLEVTKIDEVYLFEDDEEAVSAALEAGVKFIPIDELPENFDRRYLGWIDTPENRKAIEEYCKEM